jgi:hypothetical protein
MKYLVEGGPLLGGMPLYRGRIFKAPIPSDRISAKIERQELPVQRISTFMGSVLE